MGLCRGFQGKEKSNGKRKSKSSGKSRFPSGMTSKEEQTKVRVRVKARMHGLTLRCGQRYTIPSGERV